MTSRRLSHLPILDLDDKRASKESQLVAVLVDEPETTANQLVRELYGRSTVANNATFRKLRSRVKTKLLNHLYFLDHSDSRHLVTRRYEMELLELFHQLSVLHAEGEYVLAESLLRKCLRLAEEGEFTQYTVLAARLLRNIYIDKRQAAKYRSMTKKLHKQQQQLALEEEADQLYADARLALAGTVATRRALLPKLPAYITRAEELNRKAHSFNTFHVLYRLRIAREELNGNYAEIIRITAEAARRLQQGKLNERRFDKRFNHFMSVYAYLRSRQPGQGIKLAELYARDFHPSSSNWFYFHEHYLLLALHAGMYDRAQRVMLTVSKNPSYPRQREAAQQRWDLFRAYLNFLQPPAKPTAKQKRETAQWALGLPDYSRDKRGHNVAILILQMLHFLRLRDIDAVMVRIERLRKYQQRHLREAAVLRSRLFLRLLMVLVEKDFDPDECAARGQKLLKKLRTTSPPGEAYAEIEIIPYENLWALVLDVLRESDTMMAVRK